MLYEKQKKTILSTLQGGTLRRPRSSSKISTGRKTTKNLQREDGMGGLVGTQHVRIYILSNTVDGVREGESPGITRPDDVCHHGARVKPYTDLDSAQIWVTGINQRAIGCLNSVNGEVSNTHSVVFVLHKKKKTPEQSAP